MVKDYPATCSFLDKSEKAVIRKIMVQQGTLAKTGEFSRKQLHRSLLDWRIWAWSVIGFAGNITANTGPLFAPIFTVEMGFGRIAGQGMTAIPNFVSFLVSFFSGTLAQWAGSNSVLLIYAQIFNIIGLSAVRFVGLCIFNGSSILAVPTAPGWAVSNQSGTTKTSVAAAMVSAIGAFGGFAASYMYPSKDAPRYIPGHVSNISVCAFVAVATLAMRITLQISNRRRDKDPQDISGLTAEQVADLGDRHPNFRYRL
ncbi:hypothetical protein FBU59_005390 [Linderina macrospora]|uniref:Uncharacterized protein n=1 Tax=Linderina macrospora TaxID=4868 RepID=A0ACC1J2X5_9FUNG|nr:hypothetical protein FBU59_005390 [Linderina macrospora]